MVMKKLAEKILQQMSDIVYVCDLDKNVVYLNKAAEEIIGKPATEVLGKKCYQIFCDENQSCKEACPADQALAEKQAIFQKERKIKIPSGEIKEMSVSISMLYGEKNSDQVVGAIVIMQDLSRLQKTEQEKIRMMIELEREVRKRKEAADAYRQAFDQLKTTINSLPDLLFEIDAEGRYYDFHAAHPDILYVSPDVFMGKTVEETLPPEASKIIMRAIKEAAETGRHTGSVYSLEFEGQPRWFELMISSKGDPKTSEGRLIALVRDVTDRQTYQDQLEKTVRELEDAINEVNTLSGLLPICSYCKSIRNDEGYWQRLEEYIGSHSEAEFSHSICSACLEEVFPEVAAQKKDRGN
jgi:PAS domain S-box-containing protein